MISVVINDVEKRFGNVRALKSVSLEVQPGELFFLLGPSGCGKTTLLRCIAGFYLPDAGTISFGEDDVTRVPPHKRNTGMMFQSYALWPHMTVFENVAFGLKQKGVRGSERRKQVTEALESVHMEEYGRRKPNELSGGQQQRVALARALVVRPQCLLLDEPLSNLDAKLRLEMRNEIRRIAKEFQLTTIYVTHDQKEALSVADRMAILKDGELLQVGTPAEIYRRPKSKFIADFVGETNFIPGTVVRMGGGLAVIRTEYGELTGVEPQADAGLLLHQRVLVAIRPESIHIERLATDDNCLPGYLQDSVYYGELARHEFAVENGPTLHLFEMNPRIQGNRTGKKLYASIDPEDIVVVADPDASSAES